MQTRESTLRGGRGVTLHTVVWEPDDPSTVVADVALVHGYGEHSGRYVPVAEVLTAAGLRISALDLRGHGRTVGLRRGDIDDFDTLVDDVSAYVDTVRTDLPLFAYGHSMGGLAVVRLAERDDSRFAGLVITSPALAAAESIPAPLVAVANVVGKLAPGPDYKLYLSPEFVETEADFKRLARVDPTNEDALNYLQSAYRARGVAESEALIFVIPPTVFDELIELSRRS